VYASQPLSPAATQHSLPSGRYALLGPDFHRLDRTSLRLAHSFDHLVGERQIACQRQRLSSLMWQVAEAAARFTGDKVFFSLPGFSLTGLGS
jgi:hypothetical protein